MRRAPICLALLLLTPPLPAQERKPLTVEDLWAVQRVGQPALSPDGALAAVTVTRYDMEENRGNGDLWLVPVAGGAPRRLTTHKASDGSPAWSPDGTRLAFVSKRDDDKAGQLYVIPVAGGEAERVTDLPLGVSDPQWLPDGQRLVVVSHVVAGAESPEETKKALEAREKSKVKARVTEDRLFRYWDRWLTDGEYPHLFVVDVESRQVTDLLPGSKLLFGLQDGGGDFDVSPDGKSIVFAANSTEPPYSELNSDLFLVPTAGGPVRNLTADNRAGDSSPAFSPDGRSLAFLRELKADDWPDYSRLAVMDVASGRVRLLTDGWDDSAAAPAWTADGQTLVFGAEVRARTNVYAIPAAGGAPRLVQRGGTLGAPAVAPDGTLVFTHQTLSRPAELAAARLDGGGLRFLTSFNDALVALWALGEVREQTFAGAAGDEVQMYVVLPPGYQAGRRYPLVQVIHGGPVGTSADSFHPRWNAQLFAAPGYVVAMVNFHGSSSFGQKFVESILGAHPDKPFTDVMKATDLLVAQGLADPQRLAAAGGSYGGFLVDWIAGHTTRFKALVTHAGVYDLLGQWASDGTWGRQHSYGGSPFTNLANVERWSPNRYSAGFTTPMLVLHGERDFRVPVTQGLELYGVLKAKGVPARLVYYPDENHWVLKPQNSRHWYGEVLGWLQRFLGAPAGSPRE